jgi:hypothetical protein
MKFHEALLEAQLLSCAGMGMSLVIKGFIHDNTIGRQSRKCRELDEVVTHRIDNAYAGAQNNGGRDDIPDRRFQT